MPACTTCGLDEEAISVPDAVDALRTFPRRYREALAGVPDKLLRRRPDPSTWSMLEYAVHAREVFELLALALPEVLEHPHVTYPALDTDAVERERPAWVVDRDLTLEGITRACESLVHRADATPWAAWERTFTIAGREHDAGWIVRHAAHEGAHHLRDLARVRDRVAPGEND